MATTTLTDSNYDKVVNACMERVAIKKTDWSIPDPSIALVTPLLADWNTKYGVTKNKKLASSADREAKDLARKALSPVFSKFIEVNIYLNANMNAADIKSCNLEPRKTTKTKSGKPQTVPQMEYMAAPAHVIKGYYHQQPGADGVSKRGKPKGVGRVEIAYVVIDPKDPNPPKPDDNPLLQNPDDFPKRATGTKTPVQIIFATTEAGKYALLSGRWISTSNIPGDWSQLEVVMIP